MGSIPVAASFFFRITMQLLKLRHNGNDHTFHSEFTLSLMAMQQLSRLYCYTANRYCWFLLSSQLSPLFFLLYCVARFKRRLISDASQLRDLREKLYLLFAHGATSKSCTVVLFRTLFFFLETNCTAINYNLY